MDGIPFIKVTCECGSQWQVAMPPWEAAWYSWQDVKCPSCDGEPKSFIWGGIQPFGEVKLS